jgi:hypothetical protein
MLGDGIDRVAGGSVVEAKSKILNKNLYIGITPNAKQAKNKHSIP